MTLEITLYNTAVRKKEVFVPRDPSCVTIYSCGPTVYSDPHIWNMRAYVFADTLRQTLRHVWWYTLKHIINITDVGHLTDDGDQWEDKMEKWARKEWRTVWEVARTYEEHFLEYSDALRIERFDAYTRATEHILEQINMVKELQKKWFTYVIPEDWIYMDTSKVKDYGKLANLDIQGMSSHHTGDGAQIDSSKKRQITDFALWKFSLTWTQRAMEWIFSGERSGTLLTEDVRSNLSEEEEMTRWFPGWHIECSAMAVAHLWPQFDIHTWGVDHVPVHHTNEIAQAECSLGVDNRVNYRLHCQFLQMNGSKVSKSKWDDLSIPWILEQECDPLDLRYFYMTAHYRSFLDFTWEALDVAKTSRKNMIKKIAKSFSTVIDIENHTPGSCFMALSQAIADDLDTVNVLTIMHESLAKNKKEDILDILMFDVSITKFGLLEWAQELLEKIHTNTQIPENIQKIADQRLSAKKTKDYAMADILRDQLIWLWWEVKDVADGYELMKK